MNFEEFEENLEAARAKYSTVPGISSFDTLIASEDELNRAEQDLGATLPDAYRKFMRRYGGGQFLFRDIIPIVSHDGVEDDLIQVNRDINAHDFVAVVPVGTGDYWGFSAVNGECGDEVIFRDHEDGSQSQVAGDFLAFLSDYALKPSPPA